MKWEYIKALADNYVWVLKNENNEAIIIDCGDYEAVSTYIKSNNIKLKYILVTHAHADHIDGIDELRKLTKAKVVGNKHFLSRLPKLDIEIEGGDVLILLDYKIEVMNTPGHCADHLAYFATEDKLLFVGDFLFSLGCGRVFEGEPNVMVASLNSIKKLPKDTLVFTAHEYTRTNLAFVNSLGYFQVPEDVQDLILKGKMIIPTTLEFELKYNPFLNLDDESFKAILNKQQDDDVTFFKYLRELKNHSTQLIGG